MRCAPPLIACRNRNASKDARLLAAIIRPPWASDWPRHSPSRAVSALTFGKRAPSHNGCPRSESRVEGLRGSTADSPMPPGHEQQPPSRPGPRTGRDTATISCGMAEEKQQQLVAEGLKKNNCWKCLQIDQDVCCRPDVSTEKHPFCVPMKYTTKERAIKNKWPTAARPCAGGPARLRLQG